MPRRFYVPVLVTLCSLFSYFPFLFKGATPVPQPLVAIAMLVPIGIVVHDFVAALFSGPGQDGAASTELAHVQAPVRVGAMDG